MAVRNFYLSASIDGRATGLTGGPANKEGGFDLTITQRDEGDILKAAVISGRARQNGELVLTVTVAGHDTVEFRTKR